MIKQTAVMLALATTVASGAAVASDKYDHFKGLPAENLTQAVGNLASHNDKLAEVLANEELTPAQMHEIHQITYTLENAVERIEEEVERLADVLELVHKASEHADEATVRKEGAVYLQGTNQLIGRGE